MSCADVCIDMDVNVYNDFYCETQRKAQKPHICCECRETIKPGKDYWHAVGKSEGDIWTAKTCAVCYEVRRTFVCGSWEFGGLWQAIRDVLFPSWDVSGPIDCLAKVETLEARNKLRKEYADYKETT